MEWGELKNTTIKVIFHDGQSTVIKIGILLEVTHTHLILRTKHKKEALLLTSCNRIEQLPDGEIDWRDTK